MTNQIQESDVPLLDFLMNLIHNIASNKMTRQEYTDQYRIIRNLHRGDFIQGYTMCVADCVNQSYRKRNATNRCSPYGFGVFLNDTWRFLQTNQFRRDTFGNYPSASRLP